MCCNEDIIEGDMKLFILSDWLMNDAILNFLIYIIEI